MTDAANGIDRRWRMLTKALEVYPLEKALDLARQAEEFVIRGVQPTASFQDTETPDRVDGLIPIDVVISYLRENGDTVAPDGEGFILNGMIASFAEIVQRANDDRLKHNLPPFPFYSHTTHSVSGDEVAVSK